MADERFLVKLAKMEADGKSHKRGVWFINAIRFVVAVNLGLVLFSSFQEFEELKPLFGLVYAISGFVFLFEYIYRIIISEKIHRLKQYLFSFMGVVDFISIFPFLLPLFMAQGGDMTALLVFAKVFLIFKLMRYSKAFHILSDILNSVRTQLELVLAVSGSFILFSAILMYYVERTAQPELFSSIGQGLWWAIITMTTVGYGDIYPITPLGKFLAGFIALIGMVMIALPAGIISSAVKVHHKEDSQSETYCSHCGTRIEQTSDQCQNDNEEKSPENLAK